MFSNSNDAQTGRRRGTRAGGRSGRGSVGRLEVLGPEVQMVFLGIGLTAGQAIILRDRQTLASRTEIQKKIRAT
jgi:hypothetical protein